MKNLKYIILALFMIFGVACTSNKTPNAAEIEYIDTGVDSEAWVKIPAGEFLEGQHRHEKMIEKDYEIMVTDVTNKQFVKYLNEALAKEAIKVVDGKVMGYYKGDPFDGFKHEFEIKGGDHAYIDLNEHGIRIKFDGKTFTGVKGYANHPATFLTWFAANAYAKFYGWRLPTELEWERAARGTDSRTYPWGEEFTGNIANYISSHSLSERMFGLDITTTPVGFFNGKTYKGYETIDNKSPEGLYDMAGNVWQWCNDDYKNLHYRYMRGGSRMNYEYDLFVWSRNSAAPDFHSMYIGFRCVRDIK